VAQLLTSFNFIEELWNQLKLSFDPSYHLL